MMYDVCIVGGCGHVGLPLAIALASKGKKVCVQDINKESIDFIKKGVMPFQEEGAEPILKEVLKNGNLSLTTEPSSISESEIVIFIIGTPVDEHLNPKFGLMKELIEQYYDYFNDGQLLILRSTVYPGISKKIHNWIIKKGKICILHFVQKEF